MTGPRISVVMPTFNRAALLPAVLDGLVSQDIDDYEIVAVDDGSRDATPDVLAEWERRHAPKLRTFRQANAGPATARNRGAREARGDLIAFIDDDCIAEPAWLRALLGALHATGAAAVAGAVVNREEGWVGRYVNRESSIAQIVTADGTVEIITANAGVRADVFRKLGGFDEVIRVAGGEDTDFGLRLQAAGERIVLAPDARVHHRSRVDLRDYLRMIFRHGRGRRRLAERFPSYRFTVPHVRMLWLLWPFRAWVIHDYRRYRAAQIPRGETLRYLALRYLENPVRMLGYIRGS